MPLFTKRCVNPAKNKEEMHHFYSSGGRNAPLLVHFSNFTEKWPILPPLLLNFSNFTEKWWDSVEEIRFFTLIIEKY